MNSVLPQEKLKPCSDLAISFLTTLSKAILTNQKARLYPDLITFGFFCRKSSLIKIKKCYLDDKLRMGWGLALHIAPSNVPINAAFTFAFGLLSGNNNVVRLPTKSWPQIDLFQQIYNEVSQRDEFKIINGATKFIRTGHDSNELLQLVSCADALIVWGGDATVAHFKAMTKKPRCAELYFPNRTSSCLLDAKQVCDTTEVDFKQLITNFYNDTYVVDQNACSSPSKLGWLGDKKTIAEAESRFFHQLKILLLQKSYHLDPVARIDRYIDVLQDTAHAGSPLDLRQFHTDAWLQNGKNATNGRYGRYNSIHVKSLGEFIAQVDGDQTLSYYGISALTLKDEIINNGYSIDRVVPVGQALNIGVIWDGINLLSRLSKILTVN